MTRFYETQHDSLICRPAGRLLRLRPQIPGHRANGPAGRHGRFAAFLDKFTHDPHFPMTESEFFESINQDGMSGCILRPGKTPAKSAGFGFSLPESIDWTKAVTPYFAQTMGTCVADATAKLIECNIRMTHGPAGIPFRHRIDRDLIYRTGRDLFFRNQIGEGLFLDHGLKAAIHLGILPAETEIFEVQPDLESVYLALKSGPLIQGHVINSDWKKPHPDNGALPSSVKPDIFQTAHATLMLGLWKRPESIMVPFMNWWRGWGYFGLGQMTWKQWIEGRRFLFDSETQVMMGDGPYMIKLPDSWPSFDGYKSALVKINDPA